MSHDGLLTATLDSGASASAVRFSISDHSGKWLGDQIVLPANGVYSDDAIGAYSILNPTLSKTLGCSVVSPEELTFTPLDLVIDVGQNVAPASIFLTRDSAIVRLRLFFTDFFAGKTDEPLVDDAYFVSIDGHPPIETIVSGGATEYLTLRFGHLKPGRHTIAFGPELDFAGDRMSASLAFTLPLTSMP